MDRAVARVDPTEFASMIGHTAARLTASLFWPTDDGASAYASDSELYRIAVEHGGGHAVDRLASAYVKFMGDKRRELTGDRLRLSWRGFCETKARQWGTV